MSGDKFIELLSAAMAPETITSQSGDTKGVTFVFSNGRQIVAKRQRVRDARTEEELEAYVQECIA